MTLNLNLIVIAILPLTMAKKAPKKTPKKIRLYYLCLEDDVIDSVSVLPNATSWDIQKAVELQEPLLHTIWLVCSLCHTSTVS